MADFQTSTHRAKWIFAPPQLADKYKAANQRAIQVLEKYGATLMEVDVDGSLSYPSLQKDNAEKHSRPKPLSIEEEQCFRVFYENKLQEVCNNFHFPHKIQATALIYFKRFYLQWSVMEHHPKNIMLTCIYAACKIEESHVSAEELGKGISQDHQMILNNEMIVYQSLEFDLIVYAPYRSVEGFVNNMEEFCKAGDEVLPILKALQDTARLGIDKMMLTDAPLVFPPGQLALAALRDSNMLHKVLDFDSYLRSIISRQNSPHAVSELIGSLNAIDSLVKKYKFPSEKELKHINRKLKSCWGLSSSDEGKNERRNQSTSPERAPMNHKTCLDSLPMLLCYALLSQLVLEGKIVDCFLGDAMVFLFICDSDPIESLIVCKQSSLHIILRTGILSCNSQWTRALEIL